MSTDIATETTARDLYVEIEADLLATINVVDFLIDRTDSGRDIAGKAVFGLHYVLTDLRNRLKGIKVECLNAIDRQPAD